MDTVPLVHRRSLLSRCHFPIKANYNPPIRLNGRIKAQWSFCHFGLNDETASTGDKVEAFFGLY